MSLVNMTRPEQNLLTTLRSLKDHPLAPRNLMESTPFLDQLLMPKWLAPWKAVDMMRAGEVAGKAIPSLPSLNPGLNKTRRFYKFQKALCYDEADLNSCSTDLCADGDQTFDTDAYLASDIDQCAEKKWTITVDELKDQNYGTAQRRAEHIYDMAFQLRQQMSRNCITNLYATISPYLDGTPGVGVTTKHLNILNPAGDVYPIGWNKLNKEFRDGYFNGQYITFGGDTVADYLFAAKSRISPEGRIGTDLNTDNLNFVYDQQFDKIFQTLEGNALSHLVAVPVGGFAIDTWNEFEGEKKTSFEDFITTTLTIGGIKYDYMFRYEKCGFKITEMLRLHYGFLNLPNNLYCNNIGYIKHFTAGCGVMDCDGIC
jgi:hypothetical protein